MSLLGFSLENRWVVAVLCALTLGSCIPVAKSLPASFLPEDDRAKFQVTMRAPEGTSSEETMLIAERAAVELRKLPGVADILITVAEDQQVSRNYAQIYVDMVDPVKRDITQAQCMNRVRTEIVPKMPEGMRVNVAEVPDFSVGANLQNIQYVMSGPDFSLLAKMADDITANLREQKIAVDVDTTSLPSRPEVKVEIDRDRAADLGVNVADVASTVQTLIAGVKASTYPDAGEEYDIRIRAKQEYRVDASSLATMNVPSVKHGSVPLSSVVRWREGTAPSRINHYGRERQITLLANAAPGVGENVVTEAIQRRFADLKPPPGYRLQPTGNSRSSAELGRGFLLAMGMAFVFMYLILAAQFESWVYPGIILVSLPLTVPFAFLALKLFGQGLNLFSMLGLLVLFGVVKKNGILQVDHANHLRALGQSKFDSLMNANRDRLRPILMTTIAFVAGMAPLILSKGVGSGFNKATASIVIGGQTLSLLLTLVAVPVFHSLVDSIKDRLARRTAVKEDLGEENLDELVELAQRHAAHATLTPAE
jgi:multidrug efflux pump subunit AcrB